MIEAAPPLVDSGPAFEAAGLVHRVAEPDGSGPHPTIVMLHGRSGNEDVMWVFAQAAPPGWLLAAPRGIERDPAGGYAWHPRARNEWPSLSQFDPAVGHVMRFIGALPDLYNADPKRIYLMGFSQGAATSYALAMRYPGYVKAIAGLVGFVPTQCGDVNRVAPLRGLPIFMAVGREDPLIPHSRSVACAQTLQAAGADLEYHEYPTGHKLNADGMRDLESWWADRARYG